MSKKKNTDVIVDVIGNNQFQVTGSCNKIEYYDEEKQEKRYILVDLGLSQKEQDPYKAYLDNMKMLQKLPKEVVSKTDFVFLTHSHADHSCNTPYLNTSNGFEGKIISSTKTISISRKLIADSVYIHERNIEQIKSGSGKKLKPLYTEQDMHDMFGKMEAYEVGKKYKLNSNVTIQLHKNNHSVGSVGVSLWIRKPNNQIKHLLFSGDIGSRYNYKYNYFTDDYELPTKCNYFFSEATYWQDGRGFNESIANQQRNELKEYIKSQLKQNKRVLFCTFAYNRSQQLLQQLYDWFADDKDFNYPIVCDGFLTNKINDCFSNILDGEDKDKWDKTMNWSKIKFNREFPSTLATLSVRTTGVYICSSGFLTAGRAITYLSTMLGNSRDCVISIGYCGNEGSKGWAVFDSDQKTVTIGSGKDKKVIYKRADLNKFTSFSSHIQKDELFKLWADMNCDKIIVQHTECDDEFINEAKEYLRSKNKSTPIIKTNKGCCRFVL